MIKNYSRDIFHQINPQIYRLHDVTCLKSQCSCKSSQHDVTYKEAAVITPPLKVSSIYTNTLESGTHNHRRLKMNGRKRDVSSKIVTRKNNSKNVRVSFKSNPKKYDDFESSVYNVNNRPKIKRREVSLNGLYNNLEKHHVNKLPCKKGPCQKAYEASKFFHCVCDKTVNAKCRSETKKRKSSKRKSKNTCLCYATGDYKNRDVEDDNSKYFEKVRDKNKVEHIKHNLDTNEKNGDMCKEGLCRQAAKKKDNIFLCKCNKRKVVLEPTECIDSTCKTDKNSPTTKIKLKDKIISLGNKYSQKFKQLNYTPFEKDDLNKKTCVKGLCENVLINKRLNFVCKCTKKNEIKECTDDTCNVRINKNSLKTKPTQTFGIESMNITTGSSKSKKNRFICYCNSLKAKFRKDVPKHKYSKKTVYDPNDVQNVLKEQVTLKKMLNSKQDQTGEPFFDIRVNSVDMRTLNPDEVRGKVMTLGKVEKVKTCICPSHNVKRTNFLLKTACSAGVCKKAFKNKKINFTCKCTDGKAKTCSDTTCEVTQMPTWPTKQSNPIFEMKLDSNNMNVVNTKEIRNKIHDIEQSGKKDLCSTGICREAVTRKAPYICKCFQRRRQIETDECPDDICRRTDLIQMRNNTNRGLLNNNKSEISCINNIPQTVNNCNKNNQENRYKSENNANNICIINSKNCNYKPVDILKEKTRRNLKSKISCICARILSKAENMTIQTCNKTRTKQLSHTLKNHDNHINSDTYRILQTKSDILNRRQGIQITCAGDIVENVHHDDKNVAGDRNHINNNSINKSLNEKKEEFGLITENVRPGNRFCDCCNCKVVKSNSMCMSTSRKLKCTDILCRSCLSIFRKSGIRKPRYQRKPLVLKIKKEKINMPPSPMNKHTYTENCICCVCGQNIKDCNCERSLRPSKCKYVLCQSLTRLIRRYNQLVVHPDKGITRKRMKIHRRKSLSLPVENFLPGVKLHNKKYDNVEINEKLKPISVSFGNKYQKNMEDVTVSREKRKDANKNTKLSFPGYKSKVPITSDVKTKISQRDKSYHQSKITPTDKGDRICNCSHICECELSKRKSESKQRNIHKKSRKLKKRDKLKKKKSKNRNQSERQKKHKKSGLKRRKVWLANEKKFRREVAKKERVKSKKRLKQLKLEKKQLEAISKGREEIEETSCLADFFLGLLKIGFCIIKGFARVIFQFITDPKGSIRYTKQRLQDPKGTYERIKQAFLEFWGLKKLQMLKSVAGSEKMTILSDTFQNTPLYQAFADKGKTKKEKKLIDQKNKRRRRRIVKRDKAAMHGCRHMLLHTLRKTPCMWVYHICPNFYPQCLSCLAFWHNFSDLLLFLLAFIVWTPCILCFEGFRALSCCLLCTG